MLDEENTVRFSDSHAHLYVPDLKPEIDSVLQRAYDASIYRVILPNINLSTIGPMWEIADKYPGTLYPCMGLHPCDVKGDFQFVLSEMLPEFDVKKYAAVGEIGLDFYWDKTFVNQQEEAFITQVEWALEKDLGIVIHCRDSFDRVVELLESYKNKNLRGVFHCFTGTAEDAFRTQELGDFKLGIGGVVTFKNSGLKEELKKIPLEFLMLETDSPYLSPVPFRGKRNESSYIQYVVGILEDIYQTSKEEISQVTEKNVESIFRLN